MDIKELIEKCKSGDTAGWCLFIKRFGHVVKCAVKYKLKLMGCKITLNEVDDIAQEIFLDIWEKKKLDKIRETGSIKDWLIVVSINATINYVRDKKSFYDERNLRLEDNVKESLKPIFAPGSFKIWEDICSRDMLGIVKKEMDNLSDKKKLAVKLHVFEAMTFKDIALIMNIPRPTVGVLIKRAKEEIIKNLKKIR